LGGETAVGSRLSDLLSKETAMPLTMKEKQAVTKQLALAYKRTGKKVKRWFLDSVVQLRDYNCS